MYREAIYKLYKVNMDLKDNERLLLITDTEKDYLVDLMEDFVDVAGVITKEVKHHIYPSLKGHGKELPEEVWRLTFGERAVEKLREKGLLEKVLFKEDYPESEVFEILTSYAEEGEYPCILQSEFWLEFLFNHPLIWEYFLFINPTS